MFMLNKIKVMKTEFFLSVICFDCWGRSEIKYALTPTNFLSGSEKKGKGEQQKKDVPFFYFEKDKQESQ